MGVVSKVFPVLLIVFGLVLVAYFGMVGIEKEFWFYERDSGLDLVCRDPRVIENVGPMPFEGKMVALGGFIVVFTIVCLFFLRDNKKGTGGVEDEMEARRWVLGVLFVGFYTVMWIDVGAWRLLGVACLFMAGTLFVLLVGAS